MMVYIIYLHRRSGFKRPVPKHYIYITHAPNERKARDEVVRNGWTYCFTIETIATLGIWEFLAAAILPIEMNRAQMGWFKTDKSSRRSRWG
jgi:hypothetical protein